MDGIRRLRGMIAVLAVLLAVSLAAVVMLKDEPKRSGSKNDAGQDGSPLAGTREWRVHGGRSDAFLDGAVSLIRGNELWLYVLPPRAGAPVVRFAIPARTKRALNPEHLVDPPAVRVYFRRVGARHVLRGVAHPRSDGV